MFAESKSLNKGIQELFP